MWRSVALGVVLAGLLAGCSVGSGDTTRYGEVKGIVGMTGGKVDFAPRPFARLVARAVDHGNVKQVVARTMADRFGRFRMRLPVGTYEVSVVFDTVGSRVGTANVQSRATITDGRVTRLRLIEGVA